MCLSIYHSKLAEPGKVITKPIVCWKVMRKIKPVWYRKWFDKPQYLSPFRKTEYIMGDTVTLLSQVTARPRFGVQELDEVTGEPELKTKLIVSHWEVDYGIHSFVKFEDAQELQDELEDAHEPNGRKSWTIVECEIPTGSKVFKGTWTDNAGNDFDNYASSSIILKEDADYEFDWSDIFSLTEKD